MRTTLTLDDEVGKALESLRRRRGLSLRAAANEVLRAGLAAMDAAPASKPYCGPVFVGGLRPGLDPRRLNQIADDLEIEEFTG